VKRAEQKYSTEGLKVLWVGHQDKVSKLMAYAKKNGITSHFAFDKDDSMSRKYGMTYGGGVVFVDRSGMARVRIPKGFTRAQLDGSIQKIIQATSTGDTAESGSVPAGTATTGAAEAAK